MEALIWIGTIVTLAGFAGIVWSILRILRIRRAGHDDATLRAALQKVVPLNLGALLLSFLGLIMVVVGVILA